VGGRRKVPDLLVAAEESTLTASTAENGVAVILGKFLGSKGQRVPLETLISLQETLILLSQGNSRKSLTACGQKITFQIRIGLFSLNFTTTPWDSIMQWLTLCKDTLHIVAFVSWPDLQIKIMKLPFIFFLNADMSLMF
jgi:hypothetical protein